MTRIHAALLTLIVGASVVLGGVALRGSAGESAEPAPPGVAVLDAAFVERSAGLDALEASIDAELADLPTTGPVATTNVVQAAVRTHAAREDDHDGDSDSDGEHDDD